MNKMFDLEEGFYLEKWLVEPLLGRLSKNGATVQIEPKIMEVLVLLAENQLKVVRKDTFLQTVWGDANVIDHVLARAISELRRALRDNPQNPRFIQTIPKIGYRLLVPVSLETFAENDFAEIKNFQPAPTTTPPTTAAHAGAAYLSYFFAGLLTVLIFLAMLVVFLGSRHQPGNFHLH
jgi:DNA-binding winged helix-turn-helix (wHTH) protein